MANKNHITFNGGKWQVWGASVIGYGHTITEAWEDWKWKWLYG